MDRGTDDNAKRGADRSLGAKTSDQLTESIARFRDVFWNRQSTGRPPVGVVNPQVFLPIAYLRRPIDQSVLTAADVTPGLAATDYEFGFAKPTVTCDDWLPFSSPWRAIPWLEAMCGCPVRCATGSLAPGHRAESLAELAALPIPADDDWRQCLRRETSRLVATATEDCWVSPTILRGTSDVLAAMLGLEQFYCELYDDPQLVEIVVAKVNRLLIDVLDEHYSLVPPKSGGYGHIFGYWSPDKTIVLQEDVLGMCSPAVYREHFQEQTVAVVRHLGRCVLFHLHATGYQHYRHLLAVPDLAGLEFTIEANGPRPVDLVPVFREILEQQRLILFVDAWFEQLPAVLRQLPREGLYVIVRDDGIRSNDEFRQFVSAVWGRGGCG